MLPVDISCVVVEAGFLAKGHGTQVATVGERVWEVDCLNVVSHIGPSLVGELPADSTEVLVAHFVFLDMTFQHFFRTCRKCLLRIKVLD